MPFFKGFRDIYDKMIADYGLEVQMPTCFQLHTDKKELEQTKKKQLSTKQTCESRFCTKVMQLILLSIKIAHC